MSAEAALQHRSELKTGEPPVVDHEAELVTDPKRQRQIRNWWREAVIPSAAWIEARNREELAAMREERPQIQVAEIDADAAQVWHERSLAVRDVFLKEGGPGAQRVLDALLADIRNARQALGMAAP